MPAEQEIAGNVTVQNPAKTREPRTVPSGLRKGHSYAGAPTGFGLVEVVVVVVVVGGVVGLGIKGVGGSADRWVAERKIAMTVAERRMAAFVARDWAGSTESAGRKHVAQEMVPKSESESDVARKARCAEATGCLKQLGAEAEAEAEGTTDDVLSWFESEFEAAEEMVMAKVDRSRPHFHRQVQ